MRWGIGIADGERGERGFERRGKGVRNRAESDMLEGEVDGEGEAGRTVVRGLRRGQQNARNTGWDAKRGPR